MADPKKVSWAQLRVGIVAAVSMLLAAALIFLLTGNSTLLEGSSQLRTYMEDSAGMTEGSAVRLNGILAGSLKKVRLSGSSDPKRTVEIEMDVQNRFLDSIPDDSVAAISASNLLGDKYINITKGRSSTHVEKGGELKSAQVQDIPQLVQQSAVILTQFQDVVGRVDSLLKDIDSGKGNIGKLLKDEELYSPRQRNRARSRSACEGRAQQQRHHQQAAFTIPASTTTSAGPSSASTRSWPTSRKVRAAPGSCSTIRFFTTKPAFP